MTEQKDPEKWEVLESEYLFKRPWLTARRDHVRLPSGVEVPEYYVLEYPEWCNIIAITREGKFLIEKQYRHGTGCVNMEIPAGCVEAGETPLEAAKRELYEETGYAGGTWRHLMTLDPNSSSNNNHSHSFIAVGVEPVSTQHLEASEDIRVLQMDEEEVFRHLTAGDFHQAMMVAPLWLYFYERQGEQPAQ
jgi:8-oxo-dGTP pyrophosphatase MutT (NUDIX family)